MQGTFSLFEPAEILERVEQCLASGCLHVFDSNFSGNLYLKEGRLVYAATGMLTGRTALDQVCGAKKTTCVWLPGVPSPGVNLDVTVTSYLLEKRQLQTTSSRVDLTLDLMARRGTAAVPSNRQAPVENRPLPFVYVLVGEGQRVFRLEKDGAILGRDPGCDVMIDHGAVSRRHCAVRCKEEGLSVMDLGSRNGTFVNGKAIKAEALVREGEVLSFGTLSFRVTRVPKKQEDKTSLASASSQRPAGPLKL
jgi:hypothetical protein